MSSDDKSKEHKQSTQAIAQQPQEEFISPENIPTKTEDSVDTPPRAENDEPRKP